MAATRDNYQVNGNSLSEILMDLNFKLQRFADRMDKIEGIRGTAEVNSDLDLNQNNIIDLKASTTTTDGVNQGELVNPTFENVTLTANLTVAGTTTFTGLATANGGIQTTTIDSTEGFTFTDSNSVVIHQMGGV